MFPPVLTTEGGWGWAARPGSTDDPSRPSWSRPKASRGAPIARAHSVLRSEGSLEGEHRSPKVQINGVSSRMSRCERETGSRGRKYIYRSWSKVRFNDLVGFLFRNRGALSCAITCASSKLDPRFRWIGQLLFRCRLADTRSSSCLTWFFSYI